MMASSTSSSSRSAAGLKSYGGSTADEKQLNEYFFGSEHDDYYDFDGQHAHANAYAASPAPASSNGDDEEQDISFDYEYGVDYDAVIKERLDKANSAFAADSTQADKRARTLVSFDNAVTAFEIPQEDANSSNEADMPPVRGTISFAEPPKKRPSFETSATHDDDMNNKKGKLPLNDTVKKDNPDAFANKIKEAVQKYDAEQEAAAANNRLNANSQRDSTSGDSSPNYYSDQKEDRLQHPTPSGSLTPQGNTAHVNKQQSTLNNNNKNTANEKHITTRQDNKATPPPLKPTVAIKTRSVNFSSDDDFASSDEDSIRKREHQPPPPLQRPTRDSSSDDADEINESFVASTSQQHVPPVTNVNADQTQKKPNTFSFQAASSEQTRHSPDSSRDFTDSPELSGYTPSQSNKPPPPARLTREATFETPNKYPHPTESDEKPGSTSDKMVIEKDGMFVLMTSEEYTAYEKKKQLEKQKAVGAAKKPPPPPTSTATRPKTSNTGSSRARQSQTSGQQANNRAASATTDQKRNSYSESGSSRAQQRDVTKSISPIRQHNTPEYAKDYRSPYHLAVKQHKPVEETAEARRKRKEEEEEKKRQNKEAFEYWCEIKAKEDKERHEKKNEEKPNRSQEQSCSSNSEETRVSFDAWMRKKAEQQEKDREFQRQLEQLELRDKKHQSTPEERLKAFRDWVKRKKREKLEAQAQEKLEIKKWTMRRRRSRKHQRLSQALEMAQAFGYTNSHYKQVQGFSF